MVIPIGFNAARQIEILAILALCPKWFEFRKTYTKPFMVSVKSCVGTLKAGDVTPRDILGGMLGQRPHVYWRMWRPISLAEQAPDLWICGFCVTGIQKGIFG